VRKLGRIVLVLFAVMIAVPLVFSGTIYAGAWYYRIQAQRLLECVRGLRPGITTEAEAHRLLHPAEGLRDRSSNTSGGSSVLTEEYDALNNPSWTDFIFRHIPDPLRRFMGRHLMADWTMFEVSEEFRGGVLLKLYLCEMSDGVGYPYSAHTTIYAGRATEDVPQWADGKEFNGYAVHSRIVTKDMEGPPRARPFTLREDVFVDDRGTATQHRKALDFHLECFTAIRGCHDVSLLLQPEPDL
jgi:hypothetical protein